MALAAPSSTNLRNAACEQWGLIASDRHTIRADVGATYAWSDPWRHCYGYMRHFGSEAVEKFVNVLPSYRDAP